MKIFACLYLIVISGVFATHAQSFMKILNSNTLGDFDTIHGGGFIITMKDTADLPWGRQAVILDETGHVVSSFTSDSVRLTFVKQTPDKGFLLSGVMNGYEFSPDTSKSILIKTDSLFNIQWQVGVMDTSGLTGFTKPLLYNTGFIMAIGYGICAFSYTGNLLWNKNYDVAVSNLISDGYAGYLFTYSDTTVRGIIRIDSIGNVIWSKINNRINHIMDIVKTNDNNYLFLESYSTQVPFSGICILHKIDTSGNVIWSRSYSTLQSDLVGYSLLDVSDGTFIVSSHFPYLPAVVFHIDATGQVLSANQPVAQSPQRPLKMIELNGGYAATFGNAVIYFGYQSGFDSLMCSDTISVNSILNSDTLTSINKTSISGSMSLFSISSSFHPAVASSIDECLSTNIKKGEMPNHLHVFPNPANDFLNIDIGEEFNKLPVKVIISDLYGRKMFENSFIDGIEIKLNVNSLSTGVYVILIQTKQKEWKKIFNIQSRD